MNNGSEEVLVNLSDFVDRLMAEKGLSNIDEEVLAQMRKDLLERVEDRINAVVIEKIPLEKIEEFDQLLSEAPMEKVIQFCSENIKDLDQIIAAELIAFRQTYLQKDR